MAELADTPAPPSLPCTLCAATFTKPNVLALHLKQHQYAYQCRYCQRKIKKQGELLRHEATHSGDSRPKEPIKTVKNEAPQMENAFPKQKLKSVEEISKPSPPANSVGSFRSANAKSKMALEPSRAPPGPPGPPAAPRSSTGGPPAPPGPSAPPPAPAKSSAPPAPAKSSAPPAPAKSSAPPAPAKSSAPPALAKSSATPAPPKSSAPPAPGKSSAPPAPAKSSAPPAPAKSSALPAPAKSSSPVTLATINKVTLSHRNSSSTKSEGAKGKTSKVETKPEKPVATFNKKTEVKPKNSAKESVLKREVRNFPTLITERIKKSSSKTAEPSEEEKKEIYRKAKEYDEVRLRCDQLEKEIAALELKHEIEVKVTLEVVAENIPEEGAEEMEIKIESTEDEIKVEPMDENSYEEEANAEDSEIEVEERVVQDEEELDWDRDNQTIPPAWNVTRPGTRRKFQSPEGFIFDTRVKAIQFMLNSCYPDALIGLMKEHLGEEGWVEEEPCPAGWRDRRIARATGRARDREYLSPIMETVGGTRELLLHLQASGAPRVDIERVEERLGHDPLSSPSPMNLPSISSFLPSLPTSPLLPTGWTKKELGGVEVFISPSGEVVHSIHQVLAMQGTSSSSTSSSSTTTSSQEKRSPPLLQSFTTKKPRLEAEASEPEAKKPRLEAEVSRKRSLEAAVAKVRKLAEIEATSAPPPPSLTPLQISVCEGVYAKVHYPKSKKYSAMAEAWAVDRQLVIEWFRRRREAAAADTGEETEETDAKEPETRAEDTKSKPVHLKSRSKTNPRAGGKKSSGSSASGGRWTRSRESGGRVDRAARWLLEAARDKGQTGEEDLAALETETGLSGDLIRKWFQDNKNEK